MNLFGKEFPPLLLVWCLLSEGASAQTPLVTRSWFTPSVVPETQTQPVRFEATVSPNAASVAFNYNSVDRPMFDNGTNGDLVTGDGTWTILFTANEILRKNTAVRVFRPFIGQCKPAGGSSFNTVAEVWTSAIGHPLPAAKLQRSGALERRWSRRICARIEPAPGKDP